MDLRRLEVFCKVVELKSFTKAAEAVYLSQPSVSEHIRSLEETLQEKLLDRLGREVLPTGSGKILYQYARRILQLRDEALQAIEEYRGTLSGHLTLGASTIPGAYLLPQLIETFKVQHPTLQVTLKIADTAQIAVDLLHGELELGVIGARWKDQALECDEFFSDQLVLTVFPDHPWATREAVALEELGDQPFLLRERGSGTRIMMEQTLKDHGFDPARLALVAEMGSSEALRQGIKARMGISILSSLAVAEDLERGVLAAVPIQGIAMQRSFFLAQRRNRQLSPLGLAFLTHLQRHSKS